jgi:hypothetical protein
VVFIEKIKGLILHFFSIFGFFELKPARNLYFEFFSDLMGLSGFSGQFAWVKWVGFLSWTGLPGFWIMDLGIFFKI